MIVKVCGVSTPRIAEMAVEAGADWIGLVFEPRSPRYVDEIAAEAVMEAVGGRADLVGVLVEPSAALCDQLATRFRLSAVQVHGSGVDTSLITGCAVPVIRGTNVATEHEAYTLEWPPSGLVLLDSAPTSDDALPGGTGRALPLEWAANVARHRRIVLAGGITPDTVADTVARVRPYGVDASSGLESAPGVKDPDRVRAYVRAARAAFDVMEDAGDAAPGSLHRRHGSHEELARA
ncbi:MAG TPA: phosphoribosylanthranilate isomerase [Candidatus Dormibacteraeota bacterium]|jgi:phosphoribosylanthranilate isomerase|nr:phosphoribosylanthranilate isomerase [Candidatus Dormibacteraeota bacterium]